MKRTVIFAIAVCALLFVATAFAATRNFSGTVKEGGSVSFSTKFKHGKTKSVLMPIEFTNLPITCNQPIGKTHLNYRRTGDPISVKGNEFTYTATISGRRTVHYEGKFRDRGTKASGTFREHGSFTDLNSQARSCDTGTLHWTAHK
jgi:hypothetical protein